MFDKVDLDLEGAVRCLLRIWDSDDILKALANQSGKVERHPPPQYDDRGERIR